MKQNKKHIGWLVTAMVLVLLVIDQVIKIYIKTHFCLGESVRVTDWFYIEFIENNGMAWGMSFIGKLWLSLFRSAAIVVLIWYLHRLISHGVCRQRYIFLVALVLAGAIGNMIDSMFYGLVFNASSQFYVSYQVPFGTGYADFLMGKVVDMFRFPFFTFTWPEWIPLFGGSETTFFDPVFNFADACVTVGIFSLLLFCRPELERIGDDFKKEKQQEAETTITGKEEA